MSTYELNLPNLVCMKVVYRCSAVRIVMCHIMPGRVYQCCPTFCDSGPYKNSYDYYALEQGRVSDGPKG